NGLGGQTIMLIPPTAIALSWCVLQLWPDLKHQQIRRSGSPVAGLMLLFGLWLLLSSTWSAYPYASFIYAWVVGALPLWCLLWLRSPAGAAAWEPLWWCLLAVQTACLFWGLGEYVLKGARASGPFIDSNVFGALVNLFFFPLLFRFVALTRRKAPARSIW